MTAKAYGLPNSARKRLGFSYDHMGRRVQKVVSTWDGSGYVNPVTTKFVYDGWNLLAELDGDNGNTVKCSYMWGLDLSGSMQGAGGVGGLLTVSPSGNGTHFVDYDGNGNVAGLTDSSGNISARYEYDPFGQTLRCEWQRCGLEFGSILDEVHRCGVRVLLLWVSVLQSCDRELAEPRTAW
jgi:YD repeat-containing protein